MLNAKEMQPSIVFFDGHCNLCNGFIDWLVRRDKNRCFKVASLQGVTASKQLKINRQSNLESVILWQNGQVYERSEAVLRIFAELNPPWCYFQIFMHLPKSVRDPVYNWVARHRYKIFGRKNSCRVPTAQEREHFLD